MRLSTATYWQIDPVAIADILERQSGVQHACEAETSMVMALRPELVDTSRLEEAKCLDPGRVAGQAQAVHSPMKFEERTPSGTIGDPTAASAEKGEKLLQAAATAVAGVLSNDELWMLDD